MENFLSSLDQPDDATAEVEAEEPSKVPQDEHTGVGSRDEPAGVGTEEPSEVPQDEPNQMSLVGFRRAISGPSGAPTHDEASSPGSMVRTSEVPGELPVESKAKAAPAIAASSARQEEEEEKEEEKKESEDSSSSSESSSDEVRSGIIFLLSWRTVQEEEEEEKR